MKIEIFGTGCPKCGKTYEIMKAAVEGSGRDDVEIVKVQKIADITARGIMMTPAVMVDGGLKVTGRIPTAGEAAGWLK
ncbi:MAG TPA: thioredoxin family protein [bacterium]|nr:thioredoxin family protein [bacterium]